MDSERKRHRSLSHSSERRYGSQSPPSKRRRRHSRSPSPRRRDFRDRDRGYYREKSRERERDFGGYRDRGRGGRGGGRGFDRDRHRERERYDRDRSRDRERDRFGRTARRRAPSTSPSVLSGPFLSMPAWQQQTRQDPRAPPDVLGRLYEEYRNEYNDEHAKKFFEKHEQEAWFVDKYSPSALVAVRDESIAHAQSQAEKFQKELLDDVSAFPRWSYELAPAEALYLTQSLTSPSDAPEATTPRLKRHITDRFIPQENPCTVSLSKIPPTLSLELIRQHLSLAGELTFLHLEPPRPHDGFLREGFAIFAEAAGASAAVDTLSETAVEGAEPSDSRKYARDESSHSDNDDNDDNSTDEQEKASVTSTSFVIELHKTSLPPPRRNYFIAAPGDLAGDLEDAKHLTKLFDSMCEIENNLLLEKLSTKSSEAGNVIEATDEVNEEEETTKRLMLESVEGKIFGTEQIEFRLDLLISYLRQVHGHNFYTCRTYIPSQSLCIDYEEVYRVSLANVPKVDDLIHASFVTLVRERRKAFAHALEEDGWKDGSVRQNRATDKIIRRHTIKLPPNKERGDHYMCSVTSCKKIFKAVHYLKKHITTRHMKLVKDATQKAKSSQYFHNYVSDPDRLLPSTVNAQRPDPSAALGDTVPILPAYSRPPLGGFHPHPPHPPPPHPIHGGPPPPFFPMGVPPVMPPPRVVRVSGLKKADGDTYDRITQLSPPEGAKVQQDPRAPLSYKELDYKDLDSPSAKKSSAM
eukprot:TRINITY_DN511_c2_g3_i1.p1 TRINITY_DN511_c2_g3~~TRINITY_DN511_c2_g3_i1.p1  ORF type:complete len:750 (+),score=163.70 TRINITY_DN511_c2_g3_i1:138-2387(+)